MNPIVIAGIVIVTIIVVLALLVFVIPNLLVRAKSRELDRSKFDDREATTEKRRREEDV